MAVPHRSAYQGVDRLKIESQDKDRQLKGRKIVTVKLSFRRYGKNIILKH